MLTLPVVGLLEHAGLREHAQRWIAGLYYMSLSLLLICYMALRQILGALGLTSIGGHAQTVRPLDCTDGRSLCAQDSTRAR